MSEEKKDVPPPQATNGQAEKELFSEKKLDFIDSLECLYVKGNQSGRLMFADKWPLIAEKIFPAALTAYDHDGIETEEDREKRDALELEAEVNHDKLLSVFEGIDKELVVYGSLQLPALEAVMKQIDRTLAEHVFADRFVNRFFADGAPSDAMGIQNSESTDSASLNAPQMLAQDMPPPVPAADEVPTSQESPSVKDDPKAEPVDSSLKPSPEKSSDVAPAKSSVVVPDITEDAGSIGHVDHSYDTKMPDYDAPKPEVNLDGVVDDNDAAGSWLDSPEDEFEDVMPISTEPAAPPATSEPSQTSAQSMGLHAHQNAQTQKEDVSESPEAVETSKNSVPKDDVAVAPDAEIAPKNDVPELGEQADPVALAPEQSSAPSTPQAPRRPPLPDVAATPVPQAEELAKPIFGDMPPPPSVAPEPELNTPPPMPVDNAKSSAPPLPGSAPPLPGAAPSVAETQNAPPPPSDSASQEAKPRKPSLDDLPPLPGSDEN